MFDYTVNIGCASLYMTGTFNNDVYISHNPITRIDVCSVSGHPEGDRIKRRFEESTW